MLFFVKKSFALELTVAVLLGAAGYVGLHAFGEPPVLASTPAAWAWGAGGFAVIAVWNLLVQEGYAWRKGRAYADGLTSTLAHTVAGVSPIHMVVGSLAAVVGEEVFFRGWIQSQWGIGAASVLFMAAHLGPKPLRVVSYWTFAQGVWLGLVYHFSGNLLAPMIAHGAYDVSGMVYFKLFTLFHPVRDSDAPHA